MSASQKQLDRLLKPRRARSQTDASTALASLRRHVLTEGLSSVISSDPLGHPSRALAWKLFLKVPRSLQVTRYARLVAKGPSPLYEKVRNDTVRTLATDEDFKARVAEDKLVRLLEAYVWRSMDDREGEEDVVHYVQGMNVLAAPFLTVMLSEIEAFHAFSRFVEVNCPLYVTSSMEGVHRGLQLLDKCLALIDPELFAHLQKHGLPASTYAFPSVLTLCACTPPFDQVLHLWDFLLAYGVHFNILCIVAQLVLMRDDLLQDANPGKLLRTFPALCARDCVLLATGLIPDLPSELYDQLACHPYDSDLILD